MTSNREEDPINNRDIIWLRQIAEDQNRVAMQSLYESYRSRLVPFLRRMTPDTGVIEEVYNDVMLTVWNKAAQFKGDSKVSSWIFSIAYRACLKLIKRQQLRSKILETLRLETPEAAAVEDNNDTDYRQLQQALKALPAKQRLVVELSYYQGYSVEDIAQIADCPANTVKTRLHHARNKMRQYLMTSE